MSRFSFVKNNLSLDSSFYKEIEMSRLLFLLLVCAGCITGFSDMVSWEVN